MRAGIALALAALTLAGCGRAEAPAPEAADARSGWSTSAPEPALAFPALTGRVVDEAGLLTAEQEAGLSARQAALERFTTDQFVIATVNSLQGRDIADFARELANHWGIGQRDKDNGVLLLVAPNERKVRIAVGRGLEHVLTDEIARTIIERDLLPRFSGGDWYGGLDVGGRSIALVLGSQASTPRGTR